MIPNPEQWVKGFGFDTAVAGSQLWLRFNLAWEFPHAVGGAIKKKEEEGGGEGGGGGRGSERRRLRWRHRRRRRRKYFKGEKFRKGKLLGTRTSQT